MNCPIGNKRKRPLIRGYQGKIHLPTDIIWMGEAPTLVDDAIAKPFSGEIGGMLDYCISMVKRETGLANHVIVNSVVCTPPVVEGAPSKPTDESVKSCFPHVSELCLISRPKLVVTLGLVANELASMLPLEHPQFVVQTAHPAWILYRPENDQKYEIARLVAAVVKGFSQLEKVSSNGVISQRR
jgi:uracil-DNA glycosylase family 4